MTKEGSHVRSRQPTSAHGTVPACKIVVGPVSDLWPVTIRQVQVQKVQRV